MFEDHPSSWSDAHCSPEMLFQVNLTFPSCRSTISTFMLAHRFHLIAVRTSVNHVQRVSIVLRRLPRSSGNCPSILDFTSGPWTSARLPYLELLRGSPLPSAVNLRTRARVCRTAVSIAVCHQGHIQRFCRCFRSRHHVTHELVDNRAEL